MEKDPVVSLLMTALAYQDFAADHELERLKTEVMDDFSHMLIPYELCHAVPASVLLQTSLEDKISKLDLGADQVFTLAENKYNFIPLLNTTVYNATVRSVVRMDARRWKVSLSFKEPVTDLGGLSFLVDNTLFKDLNIILSDNFSSYKFLHSFRKFGRKWKKDDIFHLWRCGILPHKW